MQNNQEAAVSGSAKFDIVADGDISIRQPAVQTHSTHQKGHIELFADFPLMKPSMDPRSFQNPSQGSMSLETKRREQMMADLWSHSTGVSQNQFLSVVRELKRTKNALKEAQQKLNKISVLGDKQIESSTEDRLKSQQSEISELKKRIENLQVHKKHMKTDIEGISVAPASNSFEISRTSRENSLTKEDNDTSRREKQLQDEINNWKQKVEDLEAKNAEMKTSNSDLQKNFQEERMKMMKRQNDLAKENASLTREMNDGEEIRKILLDQINDLNFQLSEGKKHLQKLNENYEQAIQDKTVYEQKIAEIKALQVQATNPFYSSPKSAPRVSYEHPSGRTHSTVEDLHEALSKFRRQPSNTPRTYRCDRCYEEFTSEEEHLHHVQKCLD
uniref:Myosin-1-like n=1 Tax=Crassostrea virginica TaxID=6565 RepID=A0A8B8CPF8_CRAVI|nr:myosin-1-like [Crassostrea virginica]XP_022316291.1 myosin-1-like [Crassostrea virginica]